MICFEFTVHDFDVLFRHRKILHTIQINIHDDVIHSLCALLEEAQRDLKAKFNEIMANRKRSIGDAVSSKKKLKISSDATRGRPTLVQRWSIDPRNVGILHLSEIC